MGVFLRKTPAGEDFPGSISVHDEDGNKLGAISKTDRRYIELDVPEDAMLPVQISGHSAEHNCMYAKAENHNGVKDPYIREVKLEKGETVFATTEHDKELVCLTQMMRTKIARFAVWCCHRRSTQKEWRELVCR